MKLQNSVQLCFCFSIRNFKIWTLHLAKHKIFTFSGKKSLFFCYLCSLRRRLYIKSKLTWKYIKKVKYKIQVKKNPSLRLSLFDESFLIVKIGEKSLAWNFWWHFWNFSFFFFRLSLSASHRFVFCFSFHIFCSFSCLKWHLLKNVGRRTRLESERSNLFYFFLPFLELNKIKYFFFKFYFFELTFWKRKGEKWKWRRKFWYDSSMVWIFGERDREITGPGLIKPYLD